MSEVPLQPLALLRVQLVSHTVPPRITTQLGTGRGIQGYLAH